MHQNETKQQFEMHKLDERMREAHKDAHRVISKKEAAQMKVANAIVAGALVVLVGGLLFLLDVF
ncbi:hypothetical protein PZN02_003315 [Sinorhizobium garamanticum]|uniref:TMhelix containing protein n=1 Tax=Sinorhizobium garamanticum TaxID=680247 RepID=A0ABY8D9J9_9HYPH|nr:hypothetical protein [Sinorhizobium garamanticum]WEX86977.1 hypothetical protein PZN02_003315 [Sinorhizobium garamanticum]